MACEKPSKGVGGRPHYDRVMMFKVLALVKKVVSGSFVLGFESVVKQGDELGQGCQNRCRRFLPSSLRKGGHRYSQFHLQNPFRLKVPTTVSTHDLQLHSPPPPRWSLISFSVSLRGTSESNGVTHEPLVSRQKRAPSSFSKKFLKAFFDVAPVLSLVRAAHHQDDLLQSPIRI